MDRDTVLAIFLVAAACLTVVPSFPQTVGYLAVVGVTAVIVVTAIRANDGALPVRVHRAIALPLVLLWLVFVAAALVHPSLAAFVRVPVFVVFSAAFVFVVPAVVPIEAFGRASAYVGAAVTLLSVPWMLTGRFPLSAYEIPSRFVNTHVPGFAAALPQVSYLVSTAAFGWLTLFGTLAGAAVLRRTRSPPSPASLRSQSGFGRRYDRRLVAAVVICAIGLSLSRGRAALGTFALAAVLAGAYRFSGWRGFAATCLAAAGAAATGVIAAVFAPDLIAATGVSLADRTETWSTVVQAVASRPVVGWGFVNPRRVLEVAYGSHNSYLRLFFMGGFPGGIAYLALLASVIWCAVTTLRVAPAHRYALDRAVIPVAVLLFLHVFTGITVFGLSLNSVLSAIFVGYAQPTSAQRTLGVPTAVQRWTGRRGVQPKSLDD
jgi:O-antigen ligase